VNSADVIKKDNQIHRDLIARSIGVIGTVSAIHAIIEIVFFEIERWPSVVGAGAGFLLLLMAITVLPNTKTSISLPLLMGLGIPILCFRIWTMNGASGATAAWLVLGPMIVMILGTKREFVVWSIYSALAFLVTALASAIWPFRNYSEYPNALGILLTIYVLTLIAYHLFELQDLHRETEKEALKQRVRSEHNSQLASIGRLAGNLAHELNTPFTTILFLNKKLRDQIGEGISPEMSHIFERQRQVINSTSQIITTLLKSTRLSDAKTYGVIHPNILMSEVQILLENRVKFLRVRLSTHIERAKGCAPLYSSQGAISQALMILLTNSLDAIEKNKSLQEKWIEINFNFSETMVTIDVIDSGAGIPQEIQQNMFDAILSAAKDTGLSLPVAREIIKDLGGELNYLPNAKNTHFQIQLPTKAQMSTTIKEAVNG
jgi:signal transduction histidine kinase